MGSPMVMGRKTFDSLPGLLPGRRHIVLTRDPAWSAPGAEVVHSLEEAIAIAKGRLWVIGGAEIFDLFMPRADRIELTEVLADIDGDTVMPDPRSGTRWCETWSEHHAAEGERPAYRFQTLERP
jgi:dihydrofolate reductase